MRRIARPSMSAPSDSTLGREPGHFVEILPSRAQVQKGYLETVERVEELRTIVLILRADLRTPRTSQVSQQFPVSQQSHGQMYASVHGFASTYSPIRAS